MTERLEDTVDGFSQFIKMIPASVYQQHEPSEIRVEIKAGAKLRTLAELIPELDPHIRNHLEKLRR